MAKEKIVIGPQDTKGIQLPGTISLPDGKKPIKLGSGNISSLISAGGMAIVYEIWNPDLEVKRAVKLLKPDHSLESEDRFHTEMKITAKLHHPNIVEIYTVGIWNELPYIEMELLDGTTLEKLIEESGCLPAEVCTSIGIMVGRALNYAHNQNYVLYGKHYQGVIHRDLKPGNIMLTHEGVAKLMDFGIAKPMTASIHTVDDTVMGTMQYLAPEQLDGKEVDARADIYSLGAVLYEILTGTRAFPEQNLAKLVTDKLNNRFTPLTSFSAKVPPALCSLIHHCIRYEKEKRIQNTVDFLREICRVHKTLTLKAPEQAIELFLINKGREKHIVPFRKRQRALAALTWAGTMAAVIVAAAFVFLYVKPKPLMALFTAPQSGAAADRSSADSLLAHQTALAENAAVKQAVKTGDSVPDDLFKVDKKRIVRAGQEKRGEKKRPGASVNPAPSVAAPAPQETDDVKRQLLFEKLRQQLRTSDVMNMFSVEIEAGHFANGLLLYKMLPADQANSKKAMLYKLRALRGIGDVESAKNLLRANDINDGEFYLEKARSFYNAKDVGQAEEFIKRASVSPAQFMDQRAFRVLLLYLKALCASALYDAKPNAETKKETMEAWFEVKSMFRTSPDHKYFQKADAEIRRISAGVAVK